MQPDPTDREESLLVELFRGRSNQALSIASEIDPWFSAHMADIMLSLELIEYDIDEE